MFSNKLPKIIGIIVLVAIIAGYAYYQTRGISNGPIITIDYPIDGMTLEDSEVIIRGTIKNASYVTLNDRQIFIDEKDKFGEIVLLSPGYNVLKIEVKDRFERVKTEKLEVVYELGL